MEIIFTDVFVTKDTLVQHVIAATTLAVPLHASMEENAHSWIVSPTNAIVQKVKLILLVLEKTGHGFNRYSSPNLYFILR